jgi:hypothetical protein
MKNGTKITPIFFAIFTAAVFFLNNVNGPLPTQIVPIGGGCKMFHFFAIYFVEIYTKIKCTANAKIFGFPAHG